MESPGIYGSFQLQPWVLKAVGAPGIEVSDFCSSESFGLYFCKACGVGPFHVPRNWNMSDHEWLKMQGTSHGQKQVDTRWGWVNTCQYLEYVSIIIYHQDEYPFTFHLHSIYHPFTSHFFPKDLASVEVHVNGRKHREVCKKPKPKLGAVGAGSRGMPWTSFFRSLKQTPQKAADWRRTLQARVFWALFWAQYTILAGRFWSVICWKIGRNLQSVVQCVWGGIGLNRDWAGFWYHGIFITVFSRGVISPIHFWGIAKRQKPAVREVRWGPWDRRWRSVGVRDVHETLYVGFLGPPKAIVVQNTGKRQPLDIRICIIIYI